jgi:hypothetical protein
MTERKAETRQERVAYQFRAVSFQLSVKAIPCGNDRKKKQRQRQRRVAYQLRAASLKLRVKTDRSALLPDDNGKGGRRNRPPPVLFGMNFS